jgi:hypothetical protein
MNPNNPNDCDEHDHGRPETAEQPRVQQPWHKLLGPLTSTAINAETLALLRDIETARPGQQVRAAVDMIGLLCVALQIECMSRGRERVIDPVRVIDTIGPLLDVAEVASGRALDAQGSRPGDPGRRRAPPPASN